MEQEQQKQEKEKMQNHVRDKGRVCVIGAGKSGLCALRHSLDQNFNVVSYEKTKFIGGTWVLDNSIDENQQNEIHSSMYEGLRTNLPKEIMAYPDFKYPDSIEESYVSAEKVVEFVNSYAEHFKLNSHIRFQHEVIRVRPKNEYMNFKWEVIVRDLSNNSYQIEEFDFIFVCNGHYSVPIYPKVKNMEIYKGKQKHSHFYRKAAEFTGETILVIGAGPSGTDIIHQISLTAKHIYFSNHVIPALETSHLSNVTQKPDVESFTETGCIFTDNSNATFSTVIYCTGYKYSFPFLSVDCGLPVQDTYVDNLYKHCININYPTMACINVNIGLFTTCGFDYQVRFALNYFTNKKKLPSRTEMLEVSIADKKKLSEYGFKPNKLDCVKVSLFDYLTDISKIAEFKNVKPVDKKVMLYSLQKYFEVPNKFRNIRFKIIDDENFVTS